MFNTVFTWIVKTRIFKFQMSLKFPRGMKDCSNHNPLKCRDKISQERVSIATLVYCEIQQRFSRHVYLTFSPVTSPQFLGLSGWDSKNVKIH